MSEASAPTSRPAPIVLRVGVWLLIVVAVLGLVQLLVTALGFDWPSYVATEAPAAVSLGETTLVVAALAFVVQIVLALLIRRGFSWARIVSTVLVALALAALFVGFTPVAALETLVTAVAVVLVWLPPSNRFFRGAKQI